MWHDASIVTLARRPLRGLTGEAGTDPCPVNPLSYDIQDKDF